MAWWKYAAVIAIITLACAVLFFGGEERRADVLVDLTKELPSGETSSRILVTLTSPGGTYSCGTFGTAISCARITLVGGGKSIELVELGGGEYFAKGFGEGDFRLNIDLEGDGTVDGSVEFPIRRKIEILEPNPGERVSRHFDIVWAEDDKEGLDTIYLDEFEKCVREHPEDYNFYCKLIRYEASVDSDWYGHQEPCGDLSPNKFASTYGILSEKTVQVILDECVGDGIYEVTFASHYTPVQSIKNGATTFSVGITEDNVWNITIGEWDK